MKETGHGQGPVMARDGPHMTQRYVKPSPVGVVLLDAQLRLLHYNAEAARILRYPRKAGVPDLGALLRATRPQLSSSAKSVLPSALEFTSGRRRYLCRAFRLDSRPKAGSRTQSSVVVVLDRVVAQSVETTKWNTAFQLTSRESETVALLLKGLTSKEIAAEMSISPSTVKSFLKLVMVKVGASNRTGIIAKILGQASVVALFCELPWDGLVSWF